MAAPVTGQDGGLLDRAAAAARVTRLVDAARAGAGGSLLVTGAPGSGRSAVLATAHGVPVLDAGAIPAARPSGPLLVRVDDLERRSRATQRAVAGLTGSGVCVLAAWTGRGEPDGRWDEVIELTELRRTDALVLAQREGLAPWVADALVAAVGGNPLALTYVAAQLKPEEREGREPLPVALPLGPRLVGDMAARVDALGPAVAAALLSAATSRDGAAGPLHRALDDPHGIGAAEDAGLLIADGGHVRFGRPLDRAAVLAAASPCARRAAHRALAAATSEGTRAWHLAAAAEAPDEPLAAALEAHGHREQARGAAGAAAVLDRAVTLTPDPATALRRGVAAAAAMLVDGSPARAGALLDAALPGASEPELRADVQLLRGMAMQQSGRPMAAFALLEAEAERVLEHDPARAAGLLTQAAVALVAHGPMDRLRALTERAMALAPAGGEIIPAVFHAAALASLGEHARSRVLLRARHAELGTLDPTGLGHEILAVAALCHLWMEDLDDCERMLTWLVETARERGAVGPLAFPLCVQASLELRLGAFDAAAVHSAEALALGEHAGGAFPHSIVLTTAAFVAAHVGDEPGCTEHAERARALGLGLGLTSTLACVDQALGFLALGLGHADTAVGHLERALEHTRRLGSRDPSFLYTHADLVEAHVRTGNTAAAERLTEELATLAARTDGAWAAAATARCRALTAPGEALDALLAEALAAHARVELPFERARTHLCFGERLRRTRRRAQAREHLALAAATFAALGAGHWARRAEQELRAAGAPAGAPAADANEVDLTPREREVCTQVAGGATNREVAAALYLSPRTVEHHLRAAYRKLGLRSRSELSARWRA